MTGKFTVGLIVLIAIVMGASMYYLQVYGYYDKVAAPDNGMVMTTYGGSEEHIIVKDFQGIDADSSPIRYRACFDTPMSLAMLTETFQIYDKAEPLIAPNWFDCFKAGDIDAKLATGNAVAFLGTKNIHYGVDRVIAVDDKGHAYAWNQLNNCGGTDYDGTPEGEACPPHDTGAE